MISFELVVKPIIVVFRNLIFGIERVLVEVDIFGIVLIFTNDFFERWPLLLSGEIDVIVHVVVRIVLFLASKARRGTLNYLFDFLAPPKIFFSCFYRVRNLFKFVLIRKVSFDIFCDVWILGIINVVFILPLENRVHKSFDFALYTLLVNEDALTLFLLLIIHIPGISRRCLLKPILFVIGLFLCILSGPLINSLLNILNKRFALNGLFCHVANVWVSFARFHELGDASQVFRPISKLNLIEILFDLRCRISWLHHVFIFRWRKN